MGKRFTVFVIGILVLSLLAAGCTNPSGTSPNGTAGGEKDVYPEKPITLIISFAAGGNVDIGARILAKYAEKYLGQPLVIKNVDGGGGEVGVTQGLNASPDGYTIFNFGTALVTLTLMREANYHPVEDIAPICLTVSDPRIFAVKADDERFTEDGSFIQYAKDNPAQLLIGTAGAGASGHLLIEYMNSTLNIHTQPVHFGGVSEAKTALLGGHIDITSDSYGSVIGLVNEGTLKIVAVASEERMAELPDVPTFKELGVDVAMASNRGFAASKDVPAEIVKKLEDAFQQAAREPGYQEEMKNIGQPVMFLDAEDFGKLIQYEIDIYTPLVRQFN